MLCAPANGVTAYATLVDGDAMDGTYEAVVTIPTGYPGGTWEFHLRAKDTWNNWGVTNCSDEDDLLTISG